MPERIMPSIWVDKWKDMGPKTDEAAKSRWTVQGFHDPDITELNRTVPTPEASTVPLTMQVMASKKCRAFNADAKKAFMQGLRGARPKPLYAYQPQGGFEDEPEDMIVKLETEVYGLIKGPPNWRRTFFTKFKELGF